MYDIRLAYHLRNDGYALSQRVQIDRASIKTIVEHVTLSNDAL